MASNRTTVSLSSTSQAVASPHSPCTTCRQGANLRKHGIDFLAAQALWRDPSLLEIPARTSDEQRFLVIARLQGKHWSAVITTRQQVIRLISVRRSRPEEVQLYEQLCVRSAL